MYLIAVVAFLSIKSYAQRIDTNYYPPKKSDITARDYNKGVRELAYAYAEIEEHSSRPLDYIDYWRVGVAYTYMGVDKETVYELFLKSKEDSKQGFCIILNFQLREDDDRRFSRFLGKEYLNDLNECSGVNLEPVSSKNSGKSAFKKRGNYFQWKSKKNKYPKIYYDDQTIKSDNKTDKKVIIKKDKFRIQKNYKGLKFNKNRITSWDSIKLVKRYKNFSSPWLTQELKAYWADGKVKYLITTKNQ